MKIKHEEINISFIEVCFIIQKTFQVLFHVSLKKMKCQKYVSFTPRLHLSGCPLNSLQPPPGLMTGV